MPIDASQLRQRISEVLEAKAELKKLTAKPYAELSANDKYAIRYQIIVLAEALGSVCLHIAKKDLGKEPLSYADCFMLMDEEDICSNCAKDLSPIIRLRNLVTHRYWVIDDKRVYDSIKGDFKGVDKFLESVEEKYGINL